MNGERQTVDNATADNVGDSQHPRPAPFRHLCGNVELSADKSEYKVLGTPVCEVRFSAGRERTRHTYQSYPTRHSRPSTVLLVR